jgi:enoyl-CoA hydratase
MVLTGRMVSAAEFKDWGVVDSVVPDDQLMDEAMRYARAVAWHSTDNLMLGRRGMQLFWQLMGVPQYRTFASIGHPLFTNVVWREDEFNFLKERNIRGMKNSLIEMGRQWGEMGF